MKCTFRAVFADAGIAFVQLREFVFLFLREMPFRHGVC